MDRDIQKEYKVGDWQKGIADSPELGLQEIRNCNIERYPNAIMPNFQTVTTVGSVGFSLTITAVFGDVIQLGPLPAGAKLYNGQAVVFSGSLPSPLVAGTVYYLTNVFNFGTFLQVWVEDNLNEAINISAHISLGSSTTGGTVATVNMGTIQYFQTLYPANPNSFPLVFCIDSHFRVWYQSNTTTSNISTLTQGNWYLLPKSDDNTGDPTSMGLVLFTGSDGKVWLFAAGNTNLDVLDTSLVGTNSFSPSSWVIGFQTFETGFFHESFLSQTDVLYFCDGNQLDALQEAIDVSTGLPTPFDPTDTSTYVAQFNSTPALENFQGSAVIRCLENLGTNLMIGDSLSNYIYVWDELSPNFNLFIRCGEKSVIKMKNISNVLYILAGIKGIVYYTTGYAIIPLKKIPEHITGGSVTWGGIEKIDGNLLVGFQGAQGDAAGVQNGGVLKIFLTEQAYLDSIIPSGAMTIDQTVASGSISTNVTAISQYSLAPFETYYLGSANGVDVVDITTTRTDGSAYIVSKFEHVSPINATKSYEELGFELLQSLAVSESLGISYRQSIDSSFTILQTFTFANQGTVTNGFSGADIADVNTLQLKISLTSNGGRNPILTNILIK